MADEETTQEFEFDTTQEEVVGDLAGKMGFVGMLLMILGGLVTLAGLINLFGDFGQGIGNVITGVVYLLIGFWTRNASQAFRQIVDTAGQDITNLMAALGELLKLYTLQYWLIIIVLVVGLLGLIAGIFGAAAS